MRKSILLFESELRLKIGAIRQMTTSNHPGNLSEQSATISFRAKLGFISSWQSSSHFPPHALHSSICGSTSNTTSSTYPNYTKTTHNLSEWKRLNQFLPSLLSRRAHTKGQRPSRGYSRAYLFHAGPLPLPAALTRASNLFPNQPSLKNTLATQRTHIEHIARKHENLYIVLNLRRFTNKAALHPCPLQYLVIIVGKRERCWHAQSDSFFRLPPFAFHEMRKHIIIMKRYGRNFQIVSTSKLTLFFIHTVPTFKAELTTQIHRVADLEELVLRRVGITPWRQSQRLLQWAFDAAQTACTVVARKISQRFGKKTRFQRADPN